MSPTPTDDPRRSKSPSNSVVAQVIDARARDIGGFQVRRLLPAIQRRFVGPFAFFDHMGPAVFAPGTGLAVPPHPHIGLATVTYLFEGEIVHRDSLGSLQSIRPGDVNWMTAGRGIVHSERSSPESVRRGSRLHGLQLWVGLPTAREEDEPEFAHHEVRSLPELELGGVRLRVLAGAAFGARSPVVTLSPLFYVDAVLASGRTLALPDDHSERAVYVVSGAVDCGSERAESGRMLVFETGVAATLRATSDARVVLFGGEPLDGRRFIDWNFVSSSKERIEQAKADWKGRRFAVVPGDETEFVPYPR